MRTPTDGSERQAGQLFASGNTRIPRRLQRRSPRPFENDVPMMIYLPLGRVLVVVYTYRGETIRLTSAVHRLLHRFSGT